MTDPRTLKFLQNNRVAVLSVLLPDGTPHSAALHYSHRDNPPVLYFSTESTSRKCQGLMTGKSLPASVVVGFSEEEWITLQMDGAVKVLTDTIELSQAKSLHYPKHPNSQKFEPDPATAFLIFTPTWSRYTEFKHNPPLIIENN